MHSADMPHDGNDDHHRKRDLYGHTNSRIEINPPQETLPPVEPTTLVIFGGSGDLARRRLIPALYNLLLDGLMPANFVVLGLGRKPMSDEEFRATVRDGVVKHSAKR